MKSAKKKQEHEKLKLKVEQQYPEMDGMRPTKGEKAEINREEKDMNAMPTKRFYFILAKEDSHGRKRVKQSLDRKIIPCFYFWAEDTAEHLPEFIEQLKPWTFRCTRTQELTTSGNWTREPTLGSGRPGGRSINAENL